MPKEPIKRLEGRDGEIWRLYCRNWTQRELAAEFGISQQRVSQIVREVAGSIVAEEKSEIVKREVDLLNSIRREVLELWDSSPTPMVSNGRIIEGVVDHGGRLAALDRFDKLTKQLHKVLDLESSRKVDVTMVGEEEAAQRAAADSTAYVFGSTDD
jgi:hypothetical protein